MLLAGHQPNYLPYIGFFEKIAKVDYFLIVDNVQFVKRGAFGWIHRNKIKTPQGWQWLSLDCQTKGRYTQNINEVLLKPGSSCLRKHWRALEVNYRKAPFFDTYAQVFEGIYLNNQWEYLSTLNIALIKAISKSLGLKTKMDTTSNLEITGKSTELIINMCHKIGAQTYLSGMHGKDYLDLDAIQKANLEVQFQDYTHPTYRQCWQENFEPYMCALDLIFNEGPKSLKILLNNK